MLAASPRSDAIDTGMIEGLEVQRKSQNAQTFLALRCADATHTSARFGDRRPSPRRASLSSSSPAHACLMLLGIVEGAAEC